MQGPSRDVQMAWAPGEVDNHGGDDDWLGEYAEATPPNPKKAAALTRQQLSGSVA